MPGIIPDPASGGVVVRDDGGNCLAPPNVPNSYCPPAAFQTTCEVRYLAADCTARITPGQINAFQSEMLCLAATLCPDGTWNCESLCNLSSAFSCWVAGELPEQVADIACAWPNKSPVASDRLLGCSASGEPFTTTRTALLNPQVIATSICGNNTARQTLANCVISGDPNNQIQLGADGLLYLHECGCPPVEIAGPPVAPPTNNNTQTDVPWRVDTTNPLNRVLYYWDGAAWRRIGAPSHALFGNEFFEVVPPNPIPNATTIWAENTFTIPNSSPFPITVQLVQGAHYELQVGDGDNVVVTFNIHDGPNSASPALFMVPHARAAKNVGGNALDVHDSSIARSITLLIPPGGRTFTSSMSTNATLHPSGAANVGFLRHQISWIGNYAEGFN